MADRGPSHKMLGGISVQYSGDWRHAWSIYHHDALGRTVMMCGYCGKIRRLWTSNRCPQNPPPRHEVEDGVVRVRTLS